MNTETLIAAAPWVAWNAAATPLAQFHQLRRLGKVQGWSTQTFVRLTGRQALLRSAQLAVSTETTKNTHPLVGFGALGVSQSIMYGDSTIGWTRVRAGLVRGVPRPLIPWNMVLRAPHLSVARDVISQGTPFYLGSDAPTTLAWSLAATLASQPVHNVLTMMQTDEALTTWAAAKRLANEGLWFRGALGRLGLLAGVNLINHWILRDIWIEQE